MKRSFDYRRPLWACVAIVLFSLSVGTAGGQNEAGQVLELPAQDRQHLEQYLGKNVVGKAIAAKPIGNGAKSIDLRETTIHGTLVKGSGKAAKKGQWKYSRDGDADDGTWRLESGSTVLHLEVTSEGNVQVTAEEDRDQGVVSRFNPPEPRATTGMKPGESRTIDIGVKVFDLKKPDHLEHRGALKLTYTYVGAYEVTVPAGTYEAVLLKWHYKGKVGPASIEDTEYRFYSSEVGSVAFVEMKSISAMPVYNDKTKMGYVLEKAE